MSTEPESLGNCRAKALLPIPLPDEVGGPLGELSLFCVVDEADTVEGGSPSDVSVKLGEDWGRGVVGVLDELGLTTGDEPGLTGDELGLTAGDELGLTGDELGLAGDELVLRAVFIPS